MKKTIRQAALGALIAAITMSPLSLTAAESGFPLERFPVEKMGDQAALQNGARLFINYCLNCHSAAAMRYNRLTDLGLTEEQIRLNLLFASDKIGDQMKTAMQRSDAQAWFGIVPPDLSLVARARASGEGSGADWLYTYFRSYYRDAARPSGWNNALFPNVGMPHVFWELQGSRGATIEDVRAEKDEKTGRISGYVRTVTTFAVDGERTEKTETLTGAPAHPGSTLKFGPAQGGRMDAAAYDNAAADLVAYLTYMSDPSARTRTRVGVWVLLFLALFTAAAWQLNRVYWKDVK